MMDPRDHLDALQRDLDSYEHGADMMERQSGVKIERSRVWHLFARELAATARSVEAGGTPATVLHALMQEGPLAAGEIAGIVHSDPRDNDLTLSTLIALGVVEVDDSRPMPRFFITGTLDRSTGVIVESEDSLASRLAYEGSGVKMDKLIYENRDLKAEITELKLEIIRLGGSVS